MIDISSCYGEISKSVGEKRKKKVPDFMRKYLSQLLRNVILPFGPNFLFDVRHFSVISLLHGNWKNYFKEIDRVRSFLDTFFLAEREVKKELGEIF